MCYSRGERGSVAQLVEQRPEEPCVTGSSPVGATSFLCAKIILCLIAMRFSPQIDTFWQKRASRKPYKAFLKLKSRHTALFATFALRASGEPTEAFRLKIRVIFSSKMPKMAILTPFFSVFEQFLLKNVNFRQI